MKKDYMLKPMAMARLLAEATALFALLILPFVLLARCEFQQLSGTLKIALGCLSVVSLVVLPFYGFVTYKVSLNDDGLCTHALFKRQCLAWSAMRKLLLRTSWNWKRYAITAESQEISFPLWLNSVGELTETIRSRIPQQGESGGEEESAIYAQDAISLWLQFGRVGLGVLFIIVFWIFYAKVGLAPGTATGDSYLVLAVCLAASAVVGWRCLVIANLPVRVSVSGAGLEVHTCFSRKNIPWQQVLATASPFFLLPEGLLVKTGKGTLLISDNLDGADELQRKICARVSDKQGR